MNAAGVLLALVLGAALGGLYFAGLWWTLLRLDRWRRPALALAVSFLVRALPTLAAFVLLARVGLVPLGASLVGFLLARVVLSAWLRPTHPASPVRTGAREPSTTAAAEGEQRPGDGPVGGVA